MTSGLVYLFLHMLGVIFWIGSAVAIAMTAAAPTQPDSGVAQALRRVALRLTSPAMLIAFVGGLGLLIPNFTLLYARAGWMHGKLTLLLVLAGITGVLTGRLRRWTQGEDVNPRTFSRIAGAFGVIAVVIVVLAVFKPGN